MLLLLVCVNETRSGEWCRCDANLGDISREIDDGRDRGEGRTVGLNETIVDRVLRIDSLF